MATIKAFVRSKQELANLRFRILDRQAQLYYRSEILVSPKDFDEKKGLLKIAAKTSPEDRIEINEKIRSLQDTIISIMARRSFIGILYKRVQNPNLIGSMSGHIEGSRAFARYRQIDDDIKKNIISLLE